MDLAELLMFEHAVIRVRSEHIEFEGPSFEDMNRFVLKWHASIEDEVLFPILREHFSSRSAIVSDIDRISADHKLIQTLGENLEKWKKEGNEELFNERISLYVRLIREHNDKEEESIFHLWKEISEATRKETMSRAIEAFKSGALEWYTGYTGISQRMLDYIR